MPFLKVSFYDTQEILGGKGPVSRRVCQDSYYMVHIHLVQPMPTHGENSHIHGIMGMLQGLIPPTKLEIFLPHTYLTDV